MDKECQCCEGTGWLCEICKTRWEKEDGTTCCGAGMPCICNPDAEYEFNEVLCSLGDISP